MENLNIKKLDDSHFHILEMKEKNMNVEEMLSLWKKSGGKRLIDIGIDENNFELRKSYSDRYNFIYHSIGIHPNLADNNKERVKILEKELLNDKTNTIVAIGETGLDYYWDTVTKEIQQTFFKAHIELAIKHDKPIIIHNRDASSDILEILQEYKGRIYGIIHCFSSTEYYLEEFVKLGFYISFAGNVTYKKNKELQQCLNVVPLDRLLIETDSPYLSPTPKRGRLNTPNNIYHTFNYISENLKQDNLEKILSDNLTKILKL